MFLEMQTLDLPLEGSFQLALADDQKARVRDALQHEGRRVDEVALPFVWERALPRCRRPAPCAGARNSLCTFSGGAALTRSRSIPS